MISGRSRPVTNVGRSRPVNFYSLGQDRPRLARLGQHRAGPVPCNPAGGRIIPPPPPPACNMQEARRKQKKKNARGEWGVHLAWRRPLGELRCRGLEDGGAVVLLRRREKISFLPLFFSFLSLCFLFSFLFVFRFILFSSPLSRWFYLSLRSRPSLFFPSLSSVPSLSSRPLSIYKQKRKRHAFVSAPSITQRLVGHSCFRWWWWGRGERERREVFFEKKKKRFCLCFRGGKGRRRTVSFETTPFCLLFFFFIYIYIYI